MTAPFTITKFDVKAAKKVATSINHPHIHQYEELLIGVEGALEHFIDFKTTTINAPYVSFVTKGKVHRVNPQIKNGKCNIWVIRFQSEFISETIFQLYSNFHDNANISFPSELCFNRLVILCEMMYEETQQPIPNYAVIRQLLSTVFTMLEAEKRKTSDTINTNQNTTFTNFLKILEENFRRSVSVSFYAEKLFMSSRNLNLICQNTLQKSVSEIIETRKLIEAKRLLTSTDLPISDIGFELGYKEKSHFSNAFKKKSGYSPSKFRKEMKNLFT